LFTSKMSLNNSDIIWQSFPYFGEGEELLKLFKDEPYLFFLDSSLKQADYGRYSYIGFDPFEIIASCAPDALSLLKDACKRYRIEEDGPRWHFKAGAVGFISYDCGLWQENIRRTNKKDLPGEELFFGLYDRVICIDHLTKTLSVYSSGFPQNEKRSRRKRAILRLEEIIRKLLPVFSKEKTQIEAPGNRPYFAGALTSNFTKEAYCGAVRKALKYIEAGEIYQVNLSQRFTCDIDGDELDATDIYKELRRISPTSFSSYFDCGTYKILSSSPERFMCVRGRDVQTRPMKGTRPRGGGRLEDKSFKEEIERSDKEIAELLMITDLERNDLGRVCEYGSVKVKHMRTIEAYNTVYQATSTVEGKLRSDLDVFDLIQATFPGGSITGCPKIRAMEIIEELEPSRRGPYTGALGYISFDGQMDLNVLIRTLQVYKDKITFHVGGGIVADSTPQGEYQETLVKAKSLRQCLTKALSQSQTLVSL